MFNGSFYFSRITGNTDTIVIDDVPERFLENVKGLFAGETFTVQRKGQRDLVVNTPNIIITCDTEQHNCDEWRSIKPEYSDNIPSSFQLLCYDVDAESFA